MNKNDCTLGLSIPNFDLNFKCKTIKLINNELFIITESNEIFTYLRKEDKINNVAYFEKKYLLLTSLQEREEIKNLFIMKKGNEILSQNENVLLIITESLTIYYHSINDGLCISKLNLSSFLSNDLIEIYSLYKRFLLFIFKKKLILFDTFTKLIIKEEQMKLLINISNDEKVKFENFDIIKIYQVKENSFYILNKYNETIFLSITNLSQFTKLNIDYETVNVNLVKLSFNLNKFFNEESQHVMIYNQEFLFHNIGQKLMVSFVDSVEELSELSNYYSKEKFQIIYISNIFLNNSEKLIVLYKDLTCEILTYDVKLRELKQEKKFVIMIEEDEFINMNYLTGTNIIIGYTKNNITLFDLRRFKNNEKYADKVIDLQDIFNMKKKKLNSKIFFTNYFNANFEKNVDYLSKQLSKNNKIKKIKRKNSAEEIEENEALNEINDTESKSSIMNSPSIQDNHSYINQKSQYRITASAIFSYSENKSIYYIIGTNTGKIAIIDTFFTEDLTINPFFLIDYHQSQIETFNIYNNKYLIASSIDGTLSITDISNMKFDNAIKTILNKKKYVDDQNLNNMIKKNSIESNRKTSFEDYNQQFNLSYLKRTQTAYEKLGGARRNSKLNLHLNVLENSMLNHINLIPCFSLKCFNKLKRIMPVIQLDDKFYNIYITEEIKKKNNSLLAFIMENNGTVIIRMDTFEIVYRFNQITLSLSIDAIYHITSHKVLIFYLSNNTIKLSNYSTRTIDRYITNIDSIFDILRVNEKLNQFFYNSSKLEEYVNNNSCDSLRFDESELEDKKKNEKKSYYSYSKNKENNKITIAYIKKVIKDDKERELFIKKYYQNQISTSQSLNVSKNSFNALWMKNVEKYVLDKIIKIVNDNDIDDKIKKIKIMNILFNPQLFMPVKENNFNNSVKSDDNGIILNIMKLGGQYNQFISFNFDEYFRYLDRKINALKNSTYEVTRTNYFNFISLFHIWNFALDLDSYLYLHYKLCQPIFVYFPLLLGIDSTCSMILDEEASIDMNISLSRKFKEHFNYFNLYLKKTSNEKEECKEKKDLFLDKNLLLDTQKCYLVNFKNYEVSPNLSHLIHIGLFGSLIALLGYEENPRFCDFIDSEKKILKILSIKKHIEYTCLDILYQFMYENNEDFSIANNNILICDYLNMQFSIERRQKYDSFSKMRFKLSFDNIMLYINQIYKYIFNITKEDKDGLYNGFHKLNKNADITTGNKVAFLTNFELSLIYFILLYSHLCSKSGRSLPDNIPIKSAEILILFLFQLINNPNTQIILFKNAVTLLEKSADIFENIYSSNMPNYAKILLEFYTSINVPINLESLFKKYEIGTYEIIKSEETPNFLKVVIAKYIKNFSKNKISYILKIMVDEFKAYKEPANPRFYAYLIEILWLLFKDRNYKLVQYLPTVVNLLMSASFPASKELKTACAENSKKILARLILNFPMVAYHPGSQKLAVGAVDGKIFIYDMTNGVTWKNLSAHSSEISAIIFDKSGNTLVSYSSEERVVKCWKIGLTNFFSNFFTREDGYYHQIKMKKIEEIISNDDKLQNIKFQLLKKENEIMLIRENRSVDVIKI